MGQNMSSQEQPECFAMPIVTPVMIRRNRAANRKTKNKTGARGGIPEKASWVGAHAFDPTSLPSGSWNVTPAANGKKQKEKEKTDRKHAGTRKKNQRPEPRKETPAGPTWTGGKPETKAVSLFAFVSAGSDVGALRSVLGSAPDGSALNPLCLFLSRDIVERSDDVEVTH